MTKTRSYTVDEVNALIDILHASGGVMGSELVGMKMLVGILKHCECALALEVHREAAPHSRN